MKTIYHVLLLGILAGCNNNSASENAVDAPESGSSIIDTLSLPDYVQDYDDSLRNPVSEYFLADMPLRSVAALIMLDSLTPSDNVITMRIIDSATGPNPESRNFYFKALNKIIFKSDGALSEVLGDYLIDYVGKYPAEFAGRLNTMNADDKSTWIYYMSRELAFRLDNENLVNTWTGALAGNCKTCNADEKQALDKFIQTLNTATKDFLKDSHVEHEEE